MLIFTLLLILSWICLQQLLKLSLHGSPLHHGHFRPYKAVGTYTAVYYHVSPLLQGTNGFQFPWSSLHCANFVLKQPLVLQFGLPFTWQWRAGAPETTNFWKRVPECNLLKRQPSSSCVNWWTAKPATVVLMLMLLLMSVQVNAVSSSHHQSLINHYARQSKSVKYEDSLLRQIWVFVA